MLSVIFLGIVEGLTEFLPISSTGHLILADRLLGIEGPESKLFDIVIQLGAILAVCWVYRERLIGAAAGVFSESGSQHFVANIVVAFLPAAVAGVLFYQIIKEYLFSPWVVAVSLIVGGFADPADRAGAAAAAGSPHREHLDRHRAADRLLPGPGDDPRGIARRGDDHGRPDAARRSPGGDRVLVLPGDPDDARRHGLRPLQEPRDPVVDRALVIAIGFVVAFIAALFVVRRLVEFVSRHGFGVFAWYRIALGTVALIGLALVR